jgi:hypothetical protein
MTDYIVFSSSALQAFRRCPKSFELSYVWGGTGLNYIGVPSYVTDGAGFHAIASNYAKTIKGEKLEDVEPNYEMHAVFLAWLHRRGRAEFDAMQEILHVEEPVYTPLHHSYDGNETDVYLRTTFDLVYRDLDGWVVCRDYKTFEKRPSTDVDLDFQTMSYISALMKKYRTTKVRFEHVYIRRTAPGIAHNKKGEVWSEDDCYIYESIVISPQQAQVFWGEAVATAKAILRTREEGGAAYWRTGLKGVSPYTCGSCFMKHVCKAEIEHGTLDDNLISILNYERRAPLELPKEPSVNSATSAPMNVGA